MFKSTLNSPLGPIVISASFDGIISIKINVDLSSELEGTENPHTLGAARQLNEYFLGNLKEFKLPLDFSGHSKFYQSVWEELVKIPYGETRSYSDLSASIGKPGSMRAVGAANARNPIPIVVPCHRVIGKNGSLTGFAYGLEMKKQLLLHERDHSPVESGLLF